MRQLSWAKKDLVVCNQIIRMSGFLYHCLMPAVATRVGESWAPDLESMHKPTTLGDISVSVGEIENLLTQRTVALIDNNPVVLR